MHIVHISLMYISFIVYIILFIIINMVFAENDISADLAYQLVLGIINKKEELCRFMNSCIIEIKITKEESEKYKLKININLLHRPLTISFTIFL